jgi:hypothetical protein
MQLAAYAHVCDAGAHFQDEATYEGRLHRFGEDNFVGG